MSNDLFISKKWVSCEFSTSMKYAIVWAQVCSGDGSDYSFSDSTNLLVCIYGKVVSYYDKEYYYQTNSRLYMDISFMGILPVKI